MRARAYADPDVTAVQVLGHYRLRLTFADGLQGDVDVSDLADLPGDLVAPLRDPDYFRQVRVDPEQGTIVWPNGVDLAAERLYDEASDNPVGAPSGSPTLEAEEGLLGHLRSFLLHRKPSDPPAVASLVVFDSFQRFADTARDPLIEISEELGLQRDRSAELIQLALTEAEQRWDEPAVSSNPAEWVLGTAFQLARSPRREIVPAVVHEPPYTGVRVTGALALAASATRVPVIRSPDVPSSQPEVDQAIQRLYSAQYRSLVRLAVLLVRDAGTAEEIVQDAFAGALGGWHLLRDNEKALAYLRQSVVDRSRSILRHRLVVDRNLPKPPPDMPSAEHGATVLFERSAVIAALRSLPARQREALVLRFYADMSESQIAEAMQISRGAVKSHTARGMQALRRALED